MKSPNEAVKHRSSHQLGSGTQSRRVGRTIIIVILNPDPILSILIIKLPILDPGIIIVPTIITSFQSQSTRTRHGDAELSTPQSKFIVVACIVELAWFVIVIVEVDIE